MTLPTFDDVLDAATLLAGKSLVTPLLESEAINRRLGGRVLFKAESLQHTGSFKFRGAYNCIARLSDDERRRGVVAFSSGNHAQGVALAAGMLGAPAAIVMPADAPSLKIERTRAAGAEVRLYDRWGESREEIAGKIRSERGATLVPPFEHRHVIAGQGTVGLEIMEQASALGAAPDLVIAPCSGGGLGSGIALAVRRLRADAEVWLAEPRDFDDAGRTLRSGERVKNPQGVSSFCDALLSPSMGEITHAVGAPLLAGGVVASDAEVAEAMRLIFLELKLVVEPGGACAFAALLAGQLALEGRTAVVVLSGGNVDPELFAQVLRGER